MQKKILKFKASADCTVFIANDGFVFIDGHEREYDAEYVDYLIKRMPKNFEAFAIKKAKPIEKQPDKMVKDKKPWSKTK